MAPAMALGVRVNDFLETLQKRWKTKRFYYHLSDDINKTIKTLQKPLGNAFVYIIIQVII